MTKKFTEQPVSEHSKLLPGMPKDVRVFRASGLLIFITTENGLLHLSISHKKRLPSWEEVCTARYELLPDEKYFVQVLPPKAQYVNLHPYCFHLWELPLGPTTQAIADHTRGTANA